MFIGDFEKSAPWSPSSIKGCRRFLERCAAMTDLCKGEGVTPALEKSFHKTIQKVTDDIDAMKFNTAIAALMALMNEIYDAGTLTRNELETFIKLLNPFAPHLTEEIWESLGNEGFLSLAAWPTFDPAKTVDDTTEIIVQTNGKLRATVTCAKTASKDEVLALARANEKVAAMLEGKTIIKEIYVPSKLVNFVIQ
jgi:leucyl-tRNA synthetase